MIIPNVTSGIEARMSEVVNRRSLVAGTLGAGAVALAGYGLASAQSSTPDASNTNGTPTTNPGATGTANPDLVAAQFARFDEQVVALQKDLDAVAGQVETSVITDLMSQAGIHRDNAESLAASAVSDTALLQFAVAKATFRSARELLMVRLDYAGLPSEQARTSRQLADAYKMIAAGSTDLASATDTDVTFYVTTSETLYTNAYDLYTAGEYHRAVGTGRIAAGLIQIGTVLERGELPRREQLGEEPGRGVGPDGKKDDQTGPEGAEEDQAGPDGSEDDPEDIEDGMPDTSDDSEDLPDSGTPVEVPAPGF